MKVLVTGSRFWPEDHAEVIETAIVKYLLSTNPVPPRPWTLLVGDATGADAIATELWQGWGHEATVYKAKWSADCKRVCNPGHRRPTRWGSYCPAAGVYRNQRMVDAHPDICLAFPLDGSRGTWDCVARARKADIPVVVTRLDGSTEIL